jgi:hypothetical protein
VHSAMSPDKIEHEDCAPAEIENKAPFTTLLCQLTVSTVFSGLPDALVAFGLQRSTPVPGQDPVIDTQNRLREVRACHRFKGWKNRKMPFPDIWREGDPGGAECELRKSAPSKERCCLWTRAADGVIGGWLRLRLHLACGRADSEPPHPCGLTSCHAGKELFCPFTRPRPILLSSDLFNPPPIWTQRQTKSSVARMPAYLQAFGKSTKWCRSTTGVHQNTPLPKLAFGRRTKGYFVSVVSPVLGDNRCRIRS